jgi:transcriptional regulator with XRE-family HTH domain
MSISENIKAIRKSKKMTQQEVADILKINRLAFTRLETMGNDLTFNQIVNVASALEVSINELLDGVANTLENQEYEVLRNDNKKLITKLEDLEDDKKRLKKEIKDIQYIYREIEGLYIKNASLILIPFIFREFCKVIKRETHNSLYKVFEKLISIDRDIHLKQYIYDRWHIRESYITEVMSNEGILIDTLKSEDAYNKESFYSFKKEYFIFLEQYESQE